VTEPIATQQVPQLQPPPPQTGIVASGGANNNLGQVAPPTYPDWLLKTERGRTMDYEGGTFGTSNPVRLYRLRNMFGHDQNLDPGGHAGGQFASWSSPIAYLLLLATQIDLWAQFLANRYPNRQPADPFPQMQELATYCGATEYMHAQHSGGPHTRGNAIDVEYSRTPYLPMWAGQASYVWDLYSNSYAGFAASGPNSVQVQLIAPCVAIFDRVLGRRSPTAPAMVGPSFQFNTALPTILAWYDQLSQLNTALMTYFANGANPADNRVVMLSTPIGTTTLDPGGNLTGPSQGRRNPANGILGFTRPVASSLLAARVSALQNIVGLQDAATQPNLLRHQFRWAPFAFGPDIQHFDIERWNWQATHMNTGSRPPIADQQAAQTAIETALGTRTTYASSNNGPWTDAAP
jgi:hypothetical protein